MKPHLLETIVVVDPKNKIKCTWALFEMNGHLKDNIHLEQIVLLQNFSAKNLVNLPPLF
jgi:hypothetical protein